MRRLRPSDYRRMPWANGRGTTTEMLRDEAPDGTLLWRLSMASVAEDGPFSVFPGIERNLTVISGPGFRLRGEGIDLPCRPLEPVAFPGDVTVRAEGTGGIVSEDVNVMTARRLPLPSVTVERGGILAATGGTLCLLALGVAEVDGVRLDPLDLVVTREEVRLGGAAPALVIRLAL